MFNFLKSNSTKEREARAICKLLRAGKRVHMPEYLYEYIIDELAEEEIKKLRIREY